MPFFLIQRLFDGLCMIQCFSRVTGSHEEEKLDPFGMPSDELNEISIQNRPQISNYLNSVIPSTGFVVSGRDKRSDSIWITRVTTQLCLHRVGTQRPVNHLIVPDEIFR